MLQPAPAHAPQPGIPARPGQPPTRHCSSPLNVAVLCSALSTRARRALEPAPRPISRPPRGAPAHPSAAPTPDARSQHDSPALFSTNGSAPAASSAERTAKSGEWDGAVAAGSLPPSPPPSLSLVGQGRQRKGEAGSRADATASCSALPWPRRVNALTGEPSARTWGGGHRVVSGAWAGSR